MPEAKHSGSAPINPNYQILLAFKPRQVLLAERNTQTMMTTTTMKQCNSNSKTLALNPDQKALLLQSVLGYLDRNGFPKALKRLLSEAQIETDNWKTCSLNLEDVYGNYLETCTRAETKVDTYKEQDLLTDSIEQTVGKKKKKKGDQGDNNASDILAESAKNSSEVLVNDSITDSKVELSEKKKSKKGSSSLHQTEQVSTEVLKESTADAVSELQIDESTKRQKDKKKKKSKPMPESLDCNVEKLQLDSLAELNEEKIDNLKPSSGKVESVYQSEVKSKDKKKKNKLNTDPIGDNVENCQLVNKKRLIEDTHVGNLLEQSVLLPVATEDKSKEDSIFDSEAEVRSKDKKKKKKKPSKDSLVENVEQCDSALENMPDVPLDEKKVEYKEKKRTKEGSGGVPNNEDTMKGESKRDSFPTSKDAIDKEKKSSKKRKRLASEEIEVQPVEKLASEESKRRKTENVEKPMNANTGDDEQAGKESKRENGCVSQNELQITSTKQTEASANRNLEKDGEKSAAQKSRRKQHEGSAEPKTVNAFQRVKIDEVKFADERLQDNSYWAKDGAEVGYGAKAQEILGQVRGRDFRHEKTKKKRGSYRGGQIDLQAHSVKFNYSDED